MLEKNSKLHRRKTSRLENVVVERYEGSKPDVGTLTKWRLELRHWPRPKEHPMYDYADAAKAWTRKKIELYKVNYAIELHDSPSNLVHPLYPPYRIGMSIKYLSLNTALRDILEKYCDLFKQRFPPHHIYYYPGFQLASFDHMVAELIHHPKFVQKEKAFSLVTDLCNFLTQNYERKKSKDRS